MLNGIILENQVNGEKFEGSVLYKDPDDENNNEFVFV